MTERHVIKLHITTLNTKKIITDKYFINHYHKFLLALPTLKIMP